MIEHEEVQQVVPLQVDAPSVLSVRIYANLTGIGLTVGGAPSDRDPLGQHRLETFHVTLDDALAELPYLVRLALQPRSAAS